MMIHKRYRVVPALDRSLPSPTSGQPSYPRHSPRAISASCLGTLSALRREAMQQWPPWAVAPRIHTFETPLAQPVRPLGIPAARAFAEAVDVLERLAGHLPVSLARVGDLLLGHRAQDRFPYVVERGEMEADAGDEHRQGGDEAWARACKESAAEPGPAQGGGKRGRRQAGDQRRSHGGHCEQARLLELCGCRCGRGVESSLGRGHGPSSPTRGDRLPSACRVLSSAAAGGGWKRTACPAQRASP